MSGAGKLFGVGVGPGDPELLTVKAARLLREAPVAAYFAKVGETGHARRIADGYLEPDTEELRFDYPYTTEIPKRSASYRDAMTSFYDRAAAEVGTVLEDGRDVALLCEGDPLFYGSFMYVNDRLASRFDVEVVPGRDGDGGLLEPGGQADGPRRRQRLGLGRYDGGRCAARGASGRRDAAVVMKVGRHLPKIRRAVDRAGLLDRAVLVERGSMPEERIVPLRDCQDGEAPYFSLVLVPTARTTS